MSLNNLNYEELTVKPKRHSKPNVSYLSKDTETSRSAVESTLSKTQYGKCNC